MLVAFMIVAPLVLLGLLFQQIGTAAEFLRVASLRVAAAAVFKGTTRTFHQLLFGQHACLQSSAVRSEHGHAGTVGQFDAANFLHVICIDHRNVVFPRTVTHNSCPSAVKNAS